MRHLKTIATLSILLNLLLVGIVFGQWGERIFGYKHLYEWEQMAAALHGASREKAESALKNATNDMAQTKKQSAEARSKQEAILRAPTFDKDAYLEQTKQIQQLRLPLRQRYIETMAQLATEITPEERAAMADALHATRH